MLEDFSYDNRNNLDEELIRQKARLSFRSNLNGISAVWFPGIVPDTSIVSLEGNNLDDVLGKIYSRICKDRETLPKVHSRFDEYLRRGNYILDFRYYTTGSDPRDQTLHFSSGTSSSSGNRMSIMSCLIEEPINTDSRYM